MKTLYFNCHLLSDVIISESAATSGHQSTLDFIPGSNFLGIAAKELYKDNSEESILLFHSGDVQFGDAHPVCNGIRTLRVPFSLFYPKIKGDKDVYYIHHGYNRDCDKDGIDGTPQQLKQSRKGFYAFDKDKEEFVKAFTETSYALKSAYDYNKRRSEDEKMYGYESIDTGTDFLFEIRLSENAESYAEIIKKAIIGEKTLGRSKTAQYGLVQITEADRSAFPDYSLAVSRDKYGNNIQVIYADSRLIFLDDETMQPKFRITAKDLGYGEKAEIDWENSQVRSFQYAPWNNKRKTRDAERGGFEKGSVIVIKNAEAAPSSNVVGNFKNEGFGKVIFNPSFLDFDSDKNGQATWKMIDNESSKHQKRVINYGDNPLLKYLFKKMNTGNQEEAQIMKLVNEFVEEFADLFINDDSFASQWGSIRSIAMQSKSENLIKKIEDYLSHGIAETKWNENGGKVLLINFLNNHKDVNIKKLVTNLASQMQKAIK